MALFSIRVYMCEKEYPMLTIPSAPLQRCALLVVLLAALFFFVVPPGVQAQMTTHRGLTHPARLLTSTFQGEDLGGSWRDLESPTTAVSWGAGRVDQFEVGEDGQLYHYWLDPSPHLEAWGGNWAGAYGYNPAHPVALSWGAPRLDVFLVGQNGRLYHYWQGGGSVYSLEMLPATDTSFSTNSYVTAATWGRGRLDVFLVGLNGNLYHYWQDHTAAFSWENLSGNFPLGKPTAVTWGYPRLDVFLVDQQGVLMHFWQQNTPFQSQPILSGHTWASSAPPAAVSWGPGRLDLFLYDFVGHELPLYHAWQQGTDPFQAEPLPLTLQDSQPGAARAVSWGPGRLDVFAIGGYNTRTLEHLWQQNGNAFGIEAIDDNIMPESEVAATTWGPERLDVFTGYGNTYSGPMHHFWQG